LSCSQCDEGLPAHAAPSRRSGHRCSVRAVRPDGDSLRSSPLRRSFARPLRTRPRSSSTATACTCRPPG
jgi:hypothetical protein